MSTQTPDPNIEQPEQQRGSAQHIDEHRRPWFSVLSKAVIAVIVTLTIAGIYAATTVPIAVFPTANFPRVLKAGLYALAATCVGYGLFSASGFIPRMDAFAKTQQYADAVSFLNASAGPDCVVLVVDAEEAERLIPAYTSCNTYGTSVTFAGVPKERILHNYLLGLRLKGVTRNTIHGYLENHPAEVRAYFFDTWAELFAVGPDAWLRDTTAYLERSYATFLQGNLRDQIFAFRTDYLLTTGPVPKELSAQLSTLRLVQTGPWYSLYSL